MSSKLQLCLSNMTCKYFLLGCICVGVYGFKDCNAQTEIQTRAKAPDAFQLFCTDPQGYYPHVMTCPKGWLHEKTPPQPGEASPPLLVIPVQPPIAERVPR